MPVADYAWGQHDRVRDASGHLMRSALRAYVLVTADPEAALRMLDRNIQYFEPGACVEHDGPPRPEVSPG